MHEINISVVWVDGEAKTNNYTNGVLFESGKEAEKIYSAFGHPEFMDENEGTNDHILLNEEELREVAFELSATAGDNDTFVDSARELVNGIIELMQQNLIDEAEILFC